MLNFWNLEDDRLVIYLPAFDEQNTVVTAYILQGLKFQAIERLTLGLPVSPVTPQVGHLHTSLFSRSLTISLLIVVGEHSSLAAA